MAADGQGCAEDILVCGGCRAVFTDICEMATHKKNCPGGNGGAPGAAGGAGKRASTKQSTVGNADSCVSSNAGSNAGSNRGSNDPGSNRGSNAAGSNRGSNVAVSNRGSNAAGSNRGSTGGGGANCPEDAATPPRGGSQRASRTNGSNMNKSETPVCEADDGTEGTGAGNDGAELCEDVDPCDEEAMKGGKGGEVDDEKVPEILAVGSIIPREHHWYSPLGLEPGNRILICGRFRRDNVVPIIDLWHNLDEQRVFFYSVCFDDKRAVVGSKLDGKWVNKKVIPAEEFPFELASDFTLEIILKDDAFTINWRGVQGSGCFDYPFNYDVTKVNMLRIQELDMIYKIEKDWV